MAVDIRQLGMKCLWILLAVCLSLPASAMPPDTAMAALRRGVNITGWFRYPASRDPAALAAWMSDAAMADLRKAGFGFVRLAIDPAVAEAQPVRDVAVNAVCRLQRQGFVVIVDAHPVDWHLETVAADRDRLRAFWRTMAPALRRCDPARLVPEVLNEPVFPGDAPGWAALQHAILTDLRAVLPRSTMLLTGQDWGSIAGLTALTPEPDPNVLYSFHFYDPPELTTLGAWQPNLDRTAMARLPFPVTDPSACEAATDAATQGLMRYYCASNWDQSALIRRIAVASAWAHQHGVAILAGEFGASVALNPPARMAWIAGVRETLEDAGIGWALWGYDDIMGLAVRRPPATHPLLDVNVLRALGLLPERNDSGSRNDTDRP